MGESITEAHHKWLKPSADKVDRDEPLFENFHRQGRRGIPSLAGTLLEIKNQEGETVEVGTVVAFIGAERGAPVGAAFGCSVKKKRRPRLRKLQNPPSLPKAEPVAAITAAVFLRRQTVKHR